jgi:prevent-host-death family protein
MKKRAATRYNMYDAKTRFSEVVQKAREGKEVILMNRGKPVAKVVPVETKQPSRRLGLAKDIEILPGFEQIPDDFADYV